MKKKIKMRIKPRKHYVNGSRSIEGWEIYLREGEQFLKTAVNGSANRQKFTPAILYNITAMSIEKYIMALLLYYGKLPENHTMQDLVFAVKEIMTVPEDLERKMLFIDSFQEICSVSNFSIRKPDEADILLIISTGTLVKSFVENRLPL